MSQIVERIQARQQLASENRERMEAEQREFASINWGVEIAQWAAGLGGMATLTWLLKG